MRFINLCLSIPNLDTIFFYIIFVITVPAILFSSGDYETLKYYLPALVMTAVTLTEGGKPDLFTNLSSFLFAIGEILQLILQLKFLEAIMLILQKIIEFLMEKIISISPEIVGSSSFLCTLMAFLELGAKIFCITLLGHLLGPGLVFQTMASLVMSI